MSLKGTCRACGTRVKIPEKLIGTGKPLQCPRCRVQITDIEDDAPPGESRPAQAIQAPPVQVRPVQAPATGTKPCPACGETILEVARKCKHCGENLEVAADDWGRPARPEVSTVVNTTVVVTYPRTFPHLFHLYMTFLTCGLWAPVWIIHYALSSYR